MTNRGRPSAVDASSFVDYAIGSERAGWPLGRAVGRHIGRHAALAGRKVRAPQGMAVGNAHRPKGQGKRNRKQTAAAGFGRGGKGETVRSAHQQAGRPAWLGKPRQEQG